MAKGSSGIAGGTSGNAKAEIVVQSGDKVMLDSPLIYGQKDQAVTGNVRTAIEAQETKRLTAKSEYGLMLDKYGNPVGSEVHGGKGSVRMPYGVFLTKGGIFTHNHPCGKGEEGVLGGTFSPADMKTFAKNPTWTMRASAAEGTYSITKTLSFDSAGFNSYVSKINSAATSALNKANTDLLNNVRMGNVAYSDYTQKAKNNFNNFLVEVHNGMLAGQKQYGYNYTLEER